MVFTNIWQSIGESIEIIFYNLLNPFFPTGKIKIQDILACSFLDDLLEVWLSISTTHYYCFTTVTIMCWKCHKEDENIETMKFNGKYHNLDFNVLIASGHGVFWLCNSSNFLNVTNLNNCYWYVAHVCVTWVFPTRNHDLYKLGKFRYFFFHYKLLFVSV